jgi:phospholipase C
MERHVAALGRDAQVPPLRLVRGFAIIAAATVMRMDEHSSAARWLLRLASAIACALAPGCGSGSGNGDASLGSQAADAQAPDPIRCSELQRALFKYADEEEICGPVEGELRELSPVGEGHFIAWIPRTGDAELWATTSDGSLSRGPLSIRRWGGGSTNNVLVVGLGGERAIVYDQRTAAVTLFGVNLSARGTGDPLSPKLTAMSLPIAPVGRDLVPLDRDHLLARIPGDGSYEIYEIDRQVGATLPLKATAFAGKRAEFRRGHSLVALDGQHLLEWVPRTGEFRVWGVSLAAGAGDPLTSPLSQGRWTDVGPNQEIMVIAERRLLIWNRLTGELEQRTFDPAMEDPLGGPSLGTKQVGRLRSLPHGWERPPTSEIRRLVLVLQQGRSFDLYFGRYCTAPPGSAPICKDGPACCEAMPETTPGAPACTPFDAETDTFAPNVGQRCMADSINEGAMDRFVSSMEENCGDARRFACVRPGEGAIAAYHELAAGGALADRFFQSTIRTPDDELNIIYFTHGTLGISIEKSAGEPITSRLAAESVPWSVYFGDPIGRTYGQGPPLYYDNRWSHFRFMDELLYDIQTEQLAPINVVIAPDELNEKPGPGPAASGVAMVKALKDALFASARYKDETLFLVTYLTAGGYYDHVPPPAPHPSERGSGPYGPRVPMLASSPRFVVPGTISHVQMELPSVTKFIEWNWMGGVTGQAGGRDRTVNGIGSLLDPTKTGVPVP